MVNERIITIIYINFHGAHSGSSRKGEGKGQRFVEKSLFKGKSNIKFDAQMPCQSRFIFLNKNCLYTFFRLTSQFLKIKVSKSNVSYANMRLKYKLVIKPYNAGKGYL